MFLVRQVWIHFCLLFFTLMQLGCTLELSIQNSGLLAESPTPIPTESAPPEVNLVTLKSPASSPGIDNTPTVTVTGVLSGHTVKLYTDANCTVEVSSGVATGSTLDLTSSPLADGTYNFYAQAFSSSGETSSCSAATAQYVVNVPTQLVITQQPSNTDVASAIAPAMTVEFRNAANQVVNFLTDTVTVAIHTDASGASATLSGTLTVSAVAGVATFNNLVIDLPGSGYVLRFTSGTLPAEDSDPFDVDSLVLAVTAMYPTHGARWMDYVTRDSTKTPDLGSDSNCTKNFPDCWHGGEIRKVVVPDHTSCTGLSMTDQLGVFDWACSEAAAPVYFYSTLKSGRGLKNLLTATAFANNKVIVRKGTVSIGESSLAVWWTNPVSNLTLNSGGTDPVLPLNSSGTIYTVAATGTSRGFDLSADKVALVVLGTNTVSAAATLPTDCNTMLAGAQTCLVWARGNQGWVEGKFSVSSSNSGIWTGNGSGSSAYGVRLLNIEGSSSGNGSVIMVNGTNGYFEGLNVEVSTTTGFPINFHNGDQNYLKAANIRGGSRGVFVQANAWFNNLVDIQVVGVTTAGIDVLGQNLNIVNSRIYNNSGVGVDGNSTVSLTMANTIVANNSSHGIIAHDENIIRSSIFANNGGTGIINQSATFGVAFLENNIVMNNAKGVEVQADGGKYLNLMSVNNDIGIHISGASTNNTWTGRLILGNSTDCSITTTGTDPGLATNACDNQGPSDAVRTAGVSGVNYFVGSVTTDSSNTHSTGTQVASSITDWFRFDKIFRIWGKEGTQADAGLRGNCTGAGNCRVWDFSLGAGATHALNVNGVMTDGATCPASVHGDVVTEHFNFHLSNILTHAAEIIGDNLGNENGFCESHEACYFLGHLGPDQGAGTFTKRCLFVDGVGPNKVEGVTMYGR